MDIELPKDAEGREIPLDTKVLYQKDGKERQVLKWEFYLRDSVPMWIACLEHNNSYDYRNSKFLYLTPPDSWELLLADVHDTYKHMTHPDIAMRIRKLRSDD